MLAQQEDVSHFGLIVSSIFSHLESELAIAAVVDGRKALVSLCSCHDAGPLRAGPAFPGHSLMLLSAAPCYFFSPK